MGDAFERIRVVELAQWVFVPVAGALLADWGADVIRVDRPEGDPYRGLATQGIGDDGTGVNLSVALANRGKRSVALDLRTDGGREVLHRLLEDADVLLTRLRPGALDRLGLGAEEVRERYPWLVYARGHGYGVRGPDAGLPGYDSSAFWARGGVGHVLTPPEREHPISQRGASGDRNGGMALAFGVAAALVRRGRTGEGSVVDVSLLATAMWTLSSDVLSALQGAAAHLDDPVEVPAPLHHRDAHRPRRQLRGRRGAVHDLTALAPPPGAPAGAGRGHPAVPTWSSASSRRAAPGASSPPGSPSATPGSSTSWSWRSSTTPPMRATTRPTPRASRTSHT